MLVTTGSTVDTWRQPAMRSEGTFARTGRQDRLEENREMLLTTNGELECNDLCFHVCSLLGVQ